MNNLFHSLYLTIFYSRGGNPFEMQMATNVKLTILGTLFDSDCDEREGMDDKRMLEKNIKQSINWKYEMNIKRGNEGRNCKSLSPFL